MNLLNESFEPLIRAAEARSVHAIDGIGMAAAVIDTGVNYLAPGLGGGFGPGFKVDGGFDFAEGDDDPFADSWQHGTHVAGLIASQQSGAPGVAPAAEVVALRVFGDDNAGDFERVADALQWVVDHHTEFDITVVNISLSDHGNVTRDWRSRDDGIGERIAGLVARLETLRIPVVAAAGNSYFGQEGMGFVAILPATISVTASTADGRLVATAQRLSRGLGGDSATDLAAPGEGLLTVDQTTGTIRVGGTSFAAALVTGTVILLQQAYRQRFGALPPVADVVTWLKAGASSVVDQRTGIRIGQLNVAGALAFVPAPQAPRSTAVNTASAVVPAAGPPAIPTVPSQFHTKPATARSQLRPLRRRRPKPPTRRHLAPMMAHRPRLTTRTRATLSARSSMERTL